MIPENGGAGSQLYAEDVRVGMTLGPETRVPSPITLFRFSSVTWNPHRIHFDRGYAAEEGYPNILVQSHLRGAWLARLVVDWAGPAARLRAFSWQNRQFAVPGSELTYTGTVTAVDGDLISCDLAETDGGGVLCAPATARIQLPLRAEREAVT